MALAVVVAGGACVTANPTAIGLIALSVLALYAFAALATTRPADAIGPLALTLSPFLGAALMLGNSFSRIELTGSRLFHAPHLLRGPLMAIALAAALYLLLSAADPTLTDWRDAAWTALFTRDFIQRSVFFVLLTPLLLGAYGLAASTGRPVATAQAGGAGTQQGDEAPSDSPAGAAASSWRFSGPERLMVFGSAMALFVLFFAVQLSTRLGLQGVHLAPGETLAEVTHRGFGEMIGAAALCAAVIMTLDQHAHRGALERLVRVLAWGVILGSLLAVASAYQRVRFYEAAYGYTEQRLYVQACCAAVALALLLLAWELRSAIHVPRLTRRVALVLIFCVCGLSYWNSTAWIVESNVERYQRTHRLDVSYLEQLAESSPDAVPAIVTSLSALAPVDEDALLAALSHLPLVNTSELSWYEWNLSRSAAREALNGVRQKLLPASHAQLQDGLADQAERPASEGARP
jgi:hypothetical protein